MRWCTTACCRRCCGAAPNHKRCRSKSSSVAAREPLDLADRHHHPAVTWSVELHEHDRLPGSEDQLALAHRDGLAGAQKAGLDMRGGVVVDAVMPPDAFGNQFVEGIEDIDTDVRVVILVDDHGGG